MFEIKVSEKQVVQKMSLKNQNVLDLNKEFQYNYPNSSCWNIITMGNSTNFQKVRRDKLHQRNRRLDQYLPIFQSIISKAGLTQNLIQHILKSDVVQIVHLLNKREVTSEQLIAIYGQRAATVGKELVIITQDNFQFAIRKAKECDQARLNSAKNNLVLGEEYDFNKHFPELFGVPISIKDNIQMEGTVASLGLSSRANNVCKNDSPHIVCIKNAGMIPFIKTNLPQLAFAFDSNNFLWGRTLNPWNHNKSVGGSSGGEGAALAAGISPIGLANDQGGSIRIPAHFCGVSGLMPSQHRLPQIRSETKVSTAFSGKDLILPVNGPMGKSIDSLALLMKIVTTEQYYQGTNDPYIKLYPFDTKAYLSHQNNIKKLRIGVLSKLDLIQCTPACSRALQETSSYLKSEGNELIEIKLPNQTEVICSMFSEMVGEGDFKAFTDALEGEQLIPEYGQTSTITQLNWCLYGMIQCFMNCSQPRLGILLNASKKISTYDYQKMVGRVKELRQEWIEYWRNLNLDCLICPGFGIEAPNHGTSTQGDLLAAYVFIWNVLGMPVAATPVTVVKEDEQKYQSVWDDDITKVIEKSVVDSAGLPVGVQIVGLPFEEQKILGLAKRIQRHFKFYHNHPLPISQQKK